MTDHTKELDDGTVAASPSGDPWLLTPGPLTTSMSVKTAMLRDLGSRDQEFIAGNKAVRQHLVALANGEGSYECVPLQGSGTFVVEAMLRSFVGRDGRVLILVNGAYGRRMAKICDLAGIPHETEEAPETSPNDPAGLDRRLGEARDVTHVAVVHSETTTGMLNPLEEIARVTGRHRRSLLVDAMSSFGALPIDARSLQFDALATSSNKCLEGVPGIGLCIARREALEAAKGQAGSLSFDLHDQWQAMEGNGQWRFTPPTHGVLALRQALAELEEEGGVTGRGARYADNCRRLRGGMQALGFAPLLPEELQTPNIVTFLSPPDERFVFAEFYEKLRVRGYVIYPGKLTEAETFRIGCMGRLGAREIEGVLAAVGEVCEELGVRRFA